MMRERRRFVVFGFASTHEALDAESILESGGLSVVPIPAPASLTALCGIALRTEPAEAQVAERLLRESGIEPAVRQEIDDL